MNYIILVVSLEILDLGISTIFYLLYRKNEEMNNSYIEYHFEMLTNRHRVIYIPIFIRHIFLCMYMCDGDGVFYVKRALV